MHNYAFLARKALWSYHDRVATVVWDMGFVVQVWVTSSPAGDWYIHASQHHPSACR